MTTGDNHRFPLLVGDVGGTNARFGLLMKVGDQPMSIKVYPCADFPGIVDAVESYLSGIAGPRPRRAAIAVATAVVGDQVRMTNHVWQFSIEDTRRALKLDQLEIINDFTALAMALPHLHPEEVRKTGGGEAVSSAPVALLGAGTGLGVSGLIPAGKQWIPLQGEGGHVSFSPVTEQEIEILRILRQRYQHVSAERLLSGPGLVNLYQAHATIAGEDVPICSPAEISAQGKSGQCVICAAALESFCTIMGTIAGNLVLTLGARGGVYIGGGIVPALGDYFLDSPFRQRFEQKGRFSEYLAAIPSFVIVAKYPALTGAASFLLRNETAEEEK
ncbi:MAG TPA: glucokinase [Gammaproteobacteria bacterium]|nr:glucokinase [Gammaproteobacteria bacterium]